MMAAPSTLKRLSSTLIVCWSKITLAETGPFPIVLLSATKETTVVDEDTGFRMDDPYAPLLSDLAYPTGLILSPEAVKKYGKDVGRNPAGTGPYEFREWKRISTSFWIRMVATRM